MKKKHKTNYILICILIITIVIGYFIIRRNVENHTKGEPISKEFFYNISQDTIFELEVNKSYECNGGTAQWLILLHLCLQD